MSRSNSSTPSPVSAEIPAARVSRCVHRAQQPAAAEFDLRFARRQPVDLVQHQKLRIVRRSDFTQHFETRAPFAPRHAET